MADDVWILGIHMTDFGKHRDKDTLDLGSEAVLGALRDADVEMRDIGVMAAGNLIGNPGYGQMLQKQVGLRSTVLVQETHGLAVQLIDLHWPFRSASSNLVHSFADVLRFRGLIYQRI